MREKLTDATWEETRVVDRSKNLGWPALADLEWEYAEMTGLPIEDARVLVSFAQSGHPVLLTWDTWLGGGLDRWERETTAVIVESVHFNGPQENPFSVHVRHPGFGHDIASGQIMAARMVETVRSYSVGRQPRPERKTGEGR